MAQGSTSSSLIESLNTSERDVLRMRLGSFTSRRERHPRSVRASAFLPRGSPASRPEHCQLRQHEPGTSRCEPRLYLKVRG